jgi:alkylhydroperoxidase family enzyme
MRLNYYSAAPESLAATVDFHTRITKDFFDPKLKALIDLRVSQLNGCAYCSTCTATRRAPWVRRSSVWIA